ncbi:MAG: TatD family hydrolase [Candidatus Aenigmarchaeota archaeon]|nr:TatD family hydrolase [Candidatus Aenigmarchaeota archaeon]
MIDVHAHLCFEDFGNDKDMVAKRSAEEGMKAVIVGTARLDEGIEALEFCDKYKGFLFPTLGFHPTDGGENYKDVIALIRENKERIVGIGEVGLDFHWESDSSKREKQKEIFLEFIELAKETKLPLLLHTWDAERECFEIVKEHGMKKVIFHCFTGKNELAKEITDEGYYISISTGLLFSKTIRKVARDVPIEQFTLETDAPFLSPNREEDPRNYPWNIKLTAKKMAEIRKVSESEIMEAAAINAIKFFSLPLLTK